MQKILFIGVGFHAYDEFIIKELKSCYDVSYINLNIFKFKHPYRLSFYQRFGLRNKAQAGFENAIQYEIELHADMQFDVIFVIKGEYLSERNLSTIKQQNPNARLILYLWDSWNNIDNRDVLMHFFCGHIFTFDSIDSYNYDFFLRPLFYISAKYDTERTIDMSFVGVGHSLRYEWLSKIRKIADKNELSYFFFLNVGVFSYYKDLYLTHRFCRKDKKFIKKKNLAYEDYQRLLLSSKTILDYPDDNQSGLTMRTIEALGNGAKLITTNRHIREYPDIPASLYTVVDKNEITETAFIEFVNSNCDEVLPSRYSLHGFLVELSLIIE